MKEIVERFLEERVALVACLDGVVITCSRRQFNFSHCAFDIKSKSDTVKSLWPDSIVALLVRQRTGCYLWFLDLAIPECELFGFANWIAWPPSFGIFDTGIILCRVILISFVVVHFDIILDVTSASIMIVTIAKSRWLPRIFDYFDIRVSLYVIRVPRILITSQFHLEQRPSIGYVFLLDQDRSMWILNSKKLDRLIFNLLLTFLSSDEY